MNCKEIKNIIVKFIHDKVEETGLRNVVIGLSGGVDSSLVATLAVEALGKDKVIGVIMPNSYIETGSVECCSDDSGINKCRENLMDAKNLAESLGIKYYVKPLTNIMNTEYLLEFGRSYNDLVRLGNIKARMRMILLYDMAMINDAIVLGTTNKTELLLGYFTKYGDGGVDIEPISDIYKTEVFRLARYIGVPDKIVDKSPSADLWDGQTDEGELGIKYSELDQILWWLVEEEYDARELEKELSKLTSITDKIMVEKVLDMMDINYHKTHMPKSCKVGNIDVRTTIADNIRCDNDD